MRGEILQFGLLEYGNKGLNDDSAQYLIRIVTLSWYLDEKISRFFEPQRYAP